MMKVLMSPQDSDILNVIKFGDNKIQIDDNLYDFSELEDGMLTKPQYPIIRAVKKDGELYVEILNHIDNTATYDELFPTVQNINDYDELDFKNTVDIDWYLDTDRHNDLLLLSLIPSTDELMKSEIEINTLSIIMEYGGIDDVK